jgi:hypothetical protein
VLRYTNTIAKDAETREIDSNVSKVFQSLYSNPLLNNPVLVRGLLFSNGIDLSINHKLNRPVTGFIVTNSDGPVNIYQSSTLNLAPNALILLKSNADATVDILFF